MDELLRYMKAIVALQLRAASSEEEPAARAELFLVRAGLRYPEIGNLLGISSNAVKKSVQRDRSGAKPRMQSAGNGGASR
jgi:DNA-directed RNA polymerase specialized sigma24 family protein